MCKKNMIIMHIKEKQATGKKFDLVTCLRFSSEERTLNQRKRQIYISGVANVAHCDTVF